MSKFCRLFILIKCKNRYYIKIITSLKGVFIFFAFGKVVKKDLEKNGKFVIVGLYKKIV